MDRVFLLIGVAFSGVVVALLLAPLESLGWWAGWYGEGLRSPGKKEAAPYKQAGGALRRKHYLIFLDGIAKAGAVNYDDVQTLLDTLSKTLPDAVVLGDIMPYSVSNTGLTRGRLMSWYWRQAFKFKVQGKRPIMGFTINARNLFQVLVSADKRYGPVYNQSEAQIMLNSLLKNGYRLGSGVPVTLIGYSGGGQISLGCAPYLKRALGAPITLVSLGGVMSSDRGLESVEHLYHLEGGKDYVQAIGKVVFPGRWSIVRNSYWNQAERAGKITVIATGPMGHTGAGGYLDIEKMLPDGTSFSEATASHICHLVADPDLPPRPVD